ncbi:MAG: threo-3-hydroxy-L-aspartate ammonia-lyase [Phycisphaeraceae bacterium]|nr:threo-3-hydroxy-L-aspartate ammonia-lyase [Phycisphaeraceae bacterium]MCW5763401.1 threo-3-hydroxy-L-aspartate ammonia-lyase [Phycisphaeraceae bacterium]
MHDTAPDFSLCDFVTPAHIERAAARLAGVARRTPVHTSSTLDALTGARVWLKCENFQRVGAFKFRGAYNALANLESGGVLAYSSGNHAQAIALAAALLGRLAVIVMPDNAPAIKMAATRAYLDRAPHGSRIVLYNPKTESREDLGRRIASDENLTIIPPYDHPDVIAGQGTAARELFEETGSLDTLLVCCGGGGLLSGCAIAASAASPDCRVIGVEPALADDATRSFKTRMLATVSNPPTIADGARTPSLGRYTFPLVLTHVADMMTVDEAEIARATLFAFERLKLVIEPTGALALAGLLQRARAGQTEGQRIGIIISGGNIDPSFLSTLLTLAQTPSAR